MSRSLVITARQAGTANAFISVINELLNHKDNIKIEVFAYPHAKVVFDQHGIVSTAINQFSDAEKYLTIDNESILLTGTSEQIDDDAKWWVWAKQQNIKSIGFVDQWVNYWQRFTSDNSGNNKFDQTPDIVAVIDEIAKKSLLELGLEEEKIVITGTPALDLLFSCGAKTGNKLRQNLCKNSKHKLILFACDYIVHDEKYDGTPPLDKCIDMCVLAAKKCANTDQPISILIKPHPRQEGLDVFKKYECENINGLSVKALDEERLEMMLAADIIISSTSMMLFEATILLKPAISVQPNKAETWDMPDKNENIDVCLNQEDINILLEKRLHEVGKEWVKPVQKEPVSKLFIKLLAINNMVELK